MREFEIYPTEGMHMAEPFGMDGATCGNSFEEACQMACDWLKGESEWRLMHGEPMPSATIGNEPAQGGHIILVGVDVSLDAIPSVSAAEAARRLGVSRPRVSQMLADGSLVGWRDGRNTRVTLASLDARLTESPHAGRPRKELQTA